ncbi:MAG: LacI family transcriptional regulator [Sphingomonas sp.]|nr:MAG: LacI family transcriptional regulator [Sphingomonas sp.]
MNRRRSDANGQSWPTSFDVACAAGVSQPTVSRAMRDDPSVSAETRERVQAAARALNYRTDSRAARLRSGSTGTLAVVILTQPGQARARVNPFYFALLGAIGAAASDRGFHLLLSFQDSTANFRSDYEQSHEADGLIVIGSAAHAEGWAHFTAAHRQGAHVVAWGAAEDSLPTIRCDNQEGGRLAVAHLAASGRQRVAFVGPGWDGHVAFRLRREGYLTAVREAGIDPLESSVSSAGSREEQGEAAILNLLAQGQAFDSVFAASDLLALGAMKALRGAGRSIPDEVAVIGFDGILSATHSTPALSSVEQDSEVAGRLLVEAVLDRIAGADAAKTPIPMRLVVRESCGLR